ncbi:MAG: ABC transporter permease [Actinomycetota bacterium]|jgi:ribose transport system permease protein|nr:ABC transporter permease [Actinomycetota bacterium]
MKGLGVKDDAVAVEVRSDAATGAAAVRGGPPGARSGRPARRRRQLVEASILPGLWVVVVVVFGLAEPSTFLTTRNFANIFGSQAVLLVLALGLSVPLLTGDFDLSAANTLAFAGMVTAILNVNHHWPVVVAGLVGIAIGAVVGFVNALVVVKLRKDSFIITLGTGTVLAGLTFWVSNSLTITGVSHGLTAWVFSNTFLGIPLEFWYGLAATLVVLYVVGLTPLGRRMLFVGQAREVARLTGVRTDRVRMGSLVVSGVVGALAGVLYLGTTGAADPSSGTAFLLPAFAAVFLGSTSIQPGRFNPLGTFVAVYFLSTGIAGLELLGAQSYIQQLFYGAALVLAVSVSAIGKRRASA